MEILDLIYFLYADSGPEKSQNLMGSKLEQDLSSHFFHKDPISSICVILQIKQT